MLILIKHIYVIYNINAIFEICIVPEPATTSGTGLLVDRDTSNNSGAKDNFPLTMFEIDNKGILLLFISLLIQERQQKLEGCRVKYSIE